jgi:hypothetical protein
MKRLLAAYSLEDVNRWLAQNFKEKRPAFRTLIKILSEIDGDSAVVIPQKDPDIHKIITRGTEFPLSGRKLWRGAGSQCHFNISSLYMDGRIEFICTGYALAKDGGWRSHTWGLLDHRVVETTNRYLAYFGFVMSKREAQEFTEANLI